MVSPSISSPPKVLPLSYADRAKKAQNIRSPISLQPHRIAVQTVPNTTPEISAPLLASPSKPTSNSTNVDDTPDFPAVTVSTFSSHPPTSPTAPSISLTNGVKYSSNDLAEKALSIVAAHTSLPPKSPVVNVWNVRKEQMAAARSPATASSHISASQSMPLPQKASLLPNQPKTPTKSPQDSVPNSLHGPSASAATNGVPVVPPSVEYDPFVVRISTKPTHAQIPSLPPSVDTDIWPEVGKFTAAPISNTAVPGQASDLTSNSREENQSNNGSGSEQLSTSASRKSEKTKWIPIPAEELRATADALTTAEKRQNQSRKGSQHPQQQRTNPQHPHGSASASGSTQTQSRLHSASQSASQSRIQSRSGSSQSSPRFPRGRKLPSEENPVTGISGYAASNRGSTGRSPGTSSPQLQVQHQLPPTHQPLSSADDSASSTIQPANYYAQGVPPSSVPYYPPTLHQPSSYLRASSHTPHSGYLSGHNTPPLQVPPYQPVYYIPFAPYAYWNGHSRSNPGSGHHSPAYPPPSHIQGGVVIPPHLPQFVHSHLQPHQSHVPRRRSETSPLLGMRPPPPHQSQPVGGYNVPLASAGTNGSTGTGEKPVVFGSIGVPGASKCPSPAPIVDRDHRDMDEEKPFTSFSIGVGPGDAGPSRMRSRTVSSKARSRTATLSEAGSEMRPSVGADLTEEAKVIDLTDAQDSKWEFGSVAAASGLSDDAAVTTGSDRASINGALGDGGVVISGYEELPPVLASIAGFGSPLQPSLALEHSPMQHPQVLGTHSGTRSPPDQFNPQTTGSPHGSVGRGADDEFEVKDFGYGFGPVSGTGYAETITRAERAQRQKEHQRELEREKVEKAARDAFERETALREETETRELARGVVELELEKAARDAEAAIRPRRGGYYGGHERGSSGGYGGRRGRGANGFGRGRRGGGGFQQHPRHAPPFNVTPPQTRFQPLIPMGESLNGLYTHPRPLATYIPTGYENYNQPMPPLNTAAAAQVTPPVPVPISPISFPLDPIRYYLLGQLEYYLSPQNMAQDFFLRQRMDSKGWVPISLIASFNRVKQLTVDINLVRDVLVLSSVLQVKDNSVRMSGWEIFVLPDAAPSTVESEEQENNFQHNNAHQSADKVPVEADMVVDTPVHAAEEDNEVYGDIEDDDDEDVVFVIDTEVASSGLTWAPERQT
ncbi:hypothetical protein BDZ94DRAFT_1314732 [Collybia nuda]|uniref:HTH La-type RNA-binding domain-containing protein n=1 Tax=Collybia nuda TaxID=64659 RepID=A0A9P5XW87_9AGAR|nr:hypothetical protein BDZ94DRAFT_1314732 [Collybia nuda]